MSRHHRFEQVLQGKLKNPSFKKEWEASELQYRVIQTIIAERFRRNMSQEELAHKAGLPQPSIARVESGSVMPSLTTLNKIAQALGRDLEISFS